MSSVGASHVQGFNLTTRVLHVCKSPVMSSEPQIFTFTLIGYRLAGERAEPPNSFKTVICQTFININDNYYLISVIQMYNVLSLIQIK